MTPASLREWRERLGLTKTEAAARLGLSLNGYAAYERGHIARKQGQLQMVARPIPKHVALACKALALGLSPHP